MQHTSKLGGGAGSKYQHVFNFGYRSVIRHKIHSEL